MIDVFIVDDHAVVRDGLRLLLESENDICVIGEAANGREAVKGVPKLMPAVTIIDIHMPELNGIEATRQICEQLPDARLLVLSMHADAEHIYRAFKYGASGFMLKECAGSEVVSAVRLIAQGRRYVSPKITGTLVDGYLYHRQNGEQQSPVDRLTPREYQTLQLVAEGKSSAKIAEQLNLSPKTIETYRSRLMDKLSVENLPQLIKFAVRHGITSLA